jgi:hypothetical protein
MSTNPPCDGRRKGDIAWIFWSRTRRSEPYLKRNLAAVQEKLLGIDPTVLVPPKSTISDSSSDIIIVSDSDDEVHPAKKEQVRSRGVKRIDDLLLKPNLDFEQILRIDVHSIKESHRDPYESKHQYVHEGMFKSRCYIAIFCEDHRDSGSPIKREVYRDSASCSINTFQMDDRIAKVVLDGPFLIKAEKLFINRRMPKSQMASDGMTVIRGLADKYILHVFLEMDGPQQHWPPFKLTSLIKSKDALSMLLPSSEFIQLSCVTHEVYSQQQQHILDLKVGLEGMKEKKMSIPFTLAVDISWSMPHGLKSQPQVPKSKDQGTRSKLMSSMVNYKFNIGNDHRMRTKTFHDIRCALCHDSHKSLMALRFHLRTSHPEFHVEFYKGDRPHFMIDLCSAPFDESASQQSMELLNTEFQLGPPLKRFNIDKYLRGDSSWIDCRKGSNDRSLCNGRHPSVSLSFENFNDTSPDTTDAYNLSDGEREDRPVIIVPKTKKGLFDPVTKTKLIPGTSFSPSPVDESWLLKRHKDVINDFTDVTPEEKDYLIRWDEFVMKERITSNGYVADALIRFVRKNWRWFADVGTRRVEFSKHCASLLLKRVIDPACVKNCVDILNEGVKVDKSAHDDAEMTGM